MEDAKQKKYESMLFKIDFEKAFDSVDWFYMKKMLVSFGFDNRWIMWIMECVTTARAAILVNGSPTVDFELQRGLRQGDPLSLFLFLIAAEGLNIIFDQAVSGSLFHTNPIGNDKISIPLIQYADDTIILGKPSVENATVLKRILILFECISGLKINLQKSALMGINVGEERLLQLASILGCTTDFLRWKLEAKGVYSTNSAYTFLDTDDQPTAAAEKSTWKKIWSNIAIPRANVLAWRILHGRIPTSYELAKRNCLPLEASENCILCDQNQLETVLHTLFQCTKSAEIWKACLGWIGMAASYNMAPASPADHLSWFSKLLHNNLGYKLCINLWLCSVCQI